MLYQRQIIAYHGCLRERFDAVLLEGQDPPQSDEPFDWLGRGIYFWEHGPRRAKEWAEAKARREGRPLEDARVLGAIIQLGHCLDFLDTEATALLEDAWTYARALYAFADGSLPENSSASNSGDVLLRHRDCLVVNTAARVLEESGRPVQSVRGCFYEGGSAFPGGEIQKKSHIQVAVRDPSCIIGYFVPRGPEAP